MEQELTSDEIWTRIVEHLLVFTSGRPLQFSPSQALLELPYLTHLLDDSESPFDNRISKPMIIQQGRLQKQVTREELIAARNEYCSELEKRKGNWKSTFGLLTTIAKKHDIRAHVLHTFHNGLLANEFLKEQE